MMSQKYQTEQQELDERIENLETELATEKQTVENAKKWITLIKQFSIPTELTAELLNSVIEKIVVHEVTKNDMCYDEILGYDEKVKESKIQQYLNEYNDMRMRDSPYVFEQMSKAVKEFPEDFRLIVRYLEMLIMTKSTHRRSDFT